jgi:hypothetical protein
MWERKTRVLLYSHKTSHLSDINKSYNNKLCHETEEYHYHKQILSLLGQKLSSLDKQNCKNIFLHKLIIGTLQKTTYDNKIARMSLLKHKDHFLPGSFLVRNEALVVIDFETVVTVVVSGDKATVIPIGPSLGWPAQKLLPMAGLKVRIYQLKFESRHIQHTTC